MQENIKEEIIKLYKSGLSIAKVSIKTGVSGTQVRRILKSKNIQARSIRTDFEIENKIYKEYSSGESSEKIAKKYSLDGGTVRRIVKRLGGEIRPAEENKRKYPINHDFFDEINTEEKAYFLGFLTA